MISVRKRKNIKVFLITASIGIVALGGQRVKWSIQKIKYL